MKSHLLIFFLCSSCVAVAQPALFEQTIANLHLRFVDELSKPIPFYVDESTQAFVAEGNMRLEGCLINTKNNEFVDSVYFNGSTADAINQFSLKDGVLHVQYTAAVRWIDDYSTTLVLWVKRRSSQMKVTFRIDESTTIKMDIPFKPREFEVIYAATPREF